MKRLLTLSRYSGSGWEVVIRTVKLSMTSTLFVDNASREACRARPESNFLSKLYLTTSAVNGSPLWNFTPPRSLNSHWVGLRFFHDLKSRGSTLPLKSYQTTLSYSVTKREAWSLDRR